MLSPFISGIAALLLAGTAVADEPMEEMLVTGEQPGPAPQPGKVRWRRSSRRMAI